MLFSEIPESLRALTFAIYPYDEEYRVDRLNYNKRFNFFPKAIFYPTCVQEARYVLCNLIRYELSFSIRSGGHCFEPGSLSCDYIFDLSKFNEIIPDISTSTVYIGAGARLQDVIQTLGTLDYAIPTGGCPTVALGGLALGGGSGQLNRMFGLTCDSIQSVTMLNADNEVIIVDKDHHPDLFWALRGAGNGSFGCVLGYTMKMYYVPTTTFLALRWDWDPEIAAQVITRWQQWMKVAPNEITMVLSISHPKPPSITSTFTSTEWLPKGSATRSTISVYGQKIGDELFSEWLPIFASLNPRVFSNKGSYLENSKYWVEESKLPYNKTTSRILLQTMDKPAIDYITSYFQKIEIQNPAFLFYMSFESFGGKVATNEPTAFFPREAFGWWELSYYWDDKTLSKAILNESKALYAAIPDEISKYCYANIVDYDLKKKYLKRYYGDNVPRLIKIKQKYDPKDIFHWKQSIPTHLD